MKLAHWVPQISLVRSIWRCFAQKTIYFLWKFGSLPAKLLFWFPHYRAKKVVVNFIYGYQTYQEKNTRAMEKELAQSDIPVKRKIKKTIQKYHFPEIWYFWMVFWRANFHENYMVFLVRFWDFSLHWYVGLG